VRWGEIGGSGASWRNGDDARGSYARMAAFSESLPPYLLTPLFVFGKRVLGAVEVSRSFEPELCLLSGECRRYISIFLHHKNAGLLAKRNSLPCLQYGRSLRTGVCMRIWLRVCGLV